MSKSGTARLADSGESEELFSIAEAAQALGVTQRTLRFYEDKGLIQPRRVGTTRVYARREMGRMRLILRGKSLGFSIREIGEFLSLYDTEPGLEGQIRHLLGRVTDRLGELRHQRTAIEQTIAELEAIAQQSQRHLAQSHPVQSHPVQSHVAQNQLEKRHLGEV